MGRVPKVSTFSDCAHHCECVCTIYRFHIAVSASILCIMLIIVERAHFTFHGVHGPCTSHTYCHTLRQQIHWFCYSINILYIILTTHFPLCVYSVTGNSNDEFSYSCMWRAHLMRDMKMRRTITCCRHSVIHFFSTVNSMTTSESLELETWRSELSFRFADHFLSIFIGTIFKFQLYFGVNIVWGF